MVSEKITERKIHATAAYAVLQITNWSFFAAVLAFSSNVLYSLNFSDGQISIFLGIATGVAFVIQLLLSELIGRSPRVHTWGVMVLLGSAMLVSCLLVLLPSMPRAVAVGTFGLACMVLQILPALTNGIGMDAIKRGSPTDYSFARAFGSLGYSIVAYGIGQLVLRQGVTVVPISGMVLGVAFMLATLWYHRVGEGDLPPVVRETEKEKKDRGFLRKYPRFAAFLAAAIFLTLSHNLPSNYMYQIMLEKNGTASEQGIATAICALVELPVMFGFPWMQRRLRCDVWVRLSGLGMALKGLLIFLAQSPTGVYLAQVTQMVGYGLYTISSVTYGERMVDKGDSIRAQGYLAAVVTIGSLLASSTGGLICQYFGVQTMVLVSLITALTGGISLLFIVQKTE